jgi:hypothetical protein
LVRKVNTILLHNRNILESFYSRGKIIISGSELEASGYTLFWDTSRSNFYGMPRISMVYEYSLEELADGSFKICHLDWLADSL